MAQILFHSVTQSPSYSDLHDSNVFLLGGHVQGHVHLPRTTMANTGTRWNESVMRTICLNNEYMIKYLSFTKIPIQSQWYNDNTYKKVEWMYRSMILTNVDTKPISSVLQTYQLHPNRVCSPRFCPDFHRKPQRRRGRLAMASSTLRGGGERLVRREIKVDCFAPTFLKENPWR